MSAIASFIKLPAAAAEELRMDYDQCVEERGQEVADYGWSGYVLATLLPYLQEHDIDLMHSSYDALATRLCQAREATVFIFTPAHREAYLPKLSPAQFSGDELRDYFNEFNGCTEPEMGQAMLDGIAALQESLASLDADSIVLLTIG
jgi:hypothetical protein